MKRLHRKLQSRAGFTLAETLLAVLILMMVSAIVAAGIPAAKTAYEKVVTASNAEVLLSTTVATLRNELGTAQEVKLASPKVGEAATAGPVLTLYHAARGAAARLYVADTGGSRDEIMLQRYYSEEGLMADYAPSALISPQTATGNLYVTYSAVRYRDGILTFQNLEVRRASGSEPLAQRTQLSIRVLSYRAPE